jgi:hypothetical protein
MILLRLGVPARGISLIKPVGRSPMEAVVHLETYPKARMQLAKGPLLG